MKIYNTLTGVKEEFVPITRSEVKIYVCGVTVYDLCHIGHARVMVFFDVLARHFAHLGFKVNYVRNITDIDDKIIARAQENGEDFTALTARYIQAMHDDTGQLNVGAPSVEPRATKSMEEIISMISTLIAGKLAYPTASGDVYYAVKNFAAYGKLSGKNLNELKAGSRVEIGEEKHNPLDFALWKAVKPGEPCWDSPWGAGRPGWHIECSAMARQYLGDRFDIHGGGMDLVFPHHENEIAQSEGCAGHQHVNFWMHVGFVRIDDEKMSKSLNNFFTIREVVNKYHPEVVRFFLLSSHYRSPLNFSEDNLEQAKAGLTRLYSSIKDAGLSGGKLNQDWLNQYNEAMNDDFNTPEAISILFAIAREINRGDSKLVPTLCRLGGLLGILTLKPEEFLTAGATLAPEVINKLIKQRNEARANKDFAGADKIRARLAGHGITLEDGKDGTVWRKT